MHLAGHARRRTLVVLGLAFTLPTAASAWADEPVDTCAAFVAAVSAAPEACDGMAAAVESFIGSHAATLPGLKNVVDHPGCSDVVHVAYRRLNSCKADPALKAALAHLDATVESGAVAENAPEAAQPIAMAEPADTAAPDAPAEAVTVAVAKTPAVGKPVAAKKPVKPAPPDPAIVSKLCLDWETSVGDFGDKCPALGKRLFRTFRDYDINLRDIPREGEYKSALSRCTKAATAMSKCANDKEVKAALKLIGH